MIYSLKILAYCYECQDHKIPVGSVATTPSGNVAVFCPACSTVGRFKNNWAMALADYNEGKGLEEGFKPNDLPYVG